MHGTDTSGMPAADAGQVPCGAYRCRAAGLRVLLSVGSDAEWEGLCRAIGVPELIADPRFAGLEERRRNRALLDAIITAWTHDQDAEDAVARLRRRGVPARVVTDLH